MVSNESGEKLITQANLREYFQESVDTALANQKIQADQNTVYYVVNLLTAFSRADRLYDRTPDGVGLTPLASLYANAVQSPSQEARNKALRRLGDVALFISGIFADSLNRKAVDVDYYISMGESAYGVLSHGVRREARGDVLCEIFEELSGKFTDFVDVLGEVSERASFNNDADVLRLYEVWVRTRSKRAERSLRRAGIVPVASGASLEHH